MIGGVGGGPAAGHPTRPPGAGAAGMGAGAHGSGELARRWGKIVDAACVLYAVCMLFPGALNLTALLVGAFEYFISVGASRPAASVSFTGVGLAVAPGAVRAALRWRNGAEATRAWRAPRQHFLAVAMRQAVYNIILPLWDAGPFHLRGVRQLIPDQWWHLPRCRLVVFTGWCPGLLAGSAGHALGLLYTGWLACNQHGTVHVGQDPDAALEQTETCPAPSRTPAYIGGERERKGTKGMPAHANE